MNPEVDDFMVRVSVREGKEVGSLCFCTHVCVMWGYSFVGKQRFPITKETQEI